MHHSDLPTIIDNSNEYLAKGVLTVPYQTRFFELTSAQLLHLIQITKTTYKDLPVDNTILVYKGSISRSIEGRKIDLKLSNLGEWSSGLAKRIIKF